MSIKKNSISPLGQVLLADMKSKGYTQARYARLIGISSVHLNRIIMGLHIPTLKTINKIADGTDIMIDLLINKVIDR